MVQEQRKSLELNNFKAWSTVDSLDNNQPSTALLARNWQEWHKLPPTLRNQRDLSRDSLMLLWKSPLLNILSDRDRRDLPELTLLTSCDTFIFSEQILLLAYRAEKNKDASIKKVSFEEIQHIRAFRSYAAGSPLKNEYFSYQGHPSLAGHISKRAHPFFVSLLKRFIRSTPGSAYLAFMLTEYFTIEVAKTLLTDHGVQSLDLGVQLHRLHLLDESGHLKACLNKAQKHYAGMSTPRKIFFWFETLACVLLMNLTNVGALNRAAQMMAARNPHVRWFKLRFLLAGMGIGTAEKSCFAKAMQNFVRKIRPSFKDPAARFFLWILPA